MLLHLLLLSKPEDGGDGKCRWKPWASGDVAAASCEIPSRLAEKLMLDIWPSCFQTGFGFSLLFFVVLFYSKNQRADYCSLSGERKERGHPCADLLGGYLRWFLMIIEVCQKFESLLQCHNQRLKFSRILLCCI